jgi:glucose-1-phosphate thymidylyltransferase
LDCGNKKVTVHTNQRVLEFDKDTDLVSSDLTNRNSVVIPPCFIGEHVVLENAVIGPHVSLGRGTTVKNSVVTNSIVQKNAMITNSILQDSMIGNNAKILSHGKVISIGDFTTIE